MNAGYLMEVKKLFYMSVLCTIISLLKRILKRYSLWAYTAL